MGGKVLELESEKIWEAGKQEGRQEGLQEGKFQIARNMKTTGFSDEAIAMATGIDLEVVKKL